MSFMDCIEKKYLYIGLAVLCFFLFFGWLLATSKGRYTHAQEKILHTFLQRYARLAAKDAIKKDNGTIVHKSYTLLRTAQKQY